MSAVPTHWQERADTQRAKAQAERDQWRRAQAQKVKEHMPTVCESIKAHKAIFGDGFTVLHAVENGVEAGERQSQGVQASQSHNIKKRRGT